MYRPPYIRKIFFLLPFPLLPFFLLLLFSLSSSPALSKTIQGKVISVADGDTITILTNQKKQIKIRLSAVDTPEGGQAYGNKAKKFTASMVYGKQVQVEPVTKDRYGRTVAMVLVNGSNLSKQIIANGYGGFAENTVHGASVMTG